MKKFVCLVALVLCLTSVAFAEAVPSKTTGDMVKFEATAENLPADAGFSIYATEKEDVCQAEIAKLAKSGSVAEYFGEVTNAAGEVVSLSAMLGSDTLNVFEFCGIAAENYDASYGNVTVKLTFSTPYAKDEKVAVMIGLVEAQSVIWTAYEGVGVEDQGSIQVELDSEIVLAIQNGNALLAVVSK